MTNRREFLETGVAVSALPFALNGLVAPEAAAARGAAGHVALEKAIYDARYAEGRLFAAALADLGVPAEALGDGDVTDAYVELDLAWRRRPAAIAGLTQFGPMLVLERLGRERGLRVAFQVEHQVHADGVLAHIMSGAPDTLALAETLRRRELEWPVLIAALAAHCRGDCTAPISRSIATPGAKPVLGREPNAPGLPDAPASPIHYYRPLALQEGRGIPWDGPLFSWVIAPRARA